MAERVTYYAELGDGDSVRRPNALLRRREWETGVREEAFTRNFTWEFTSALASWRRGNLDYEYVEVSERRANKIKEWLTREFEKAARAKDDD